jgi:hypothetical protein
MRGATCSTCSFDYFQPQGLTEEQQELFKYIEDADLWRWRLPDSEAFTAGASGVVQQTWWSRGVSNGMRTHIDVQ